MSLSGATQLFAMDTLSQSATAEHQIGALGITKDGRTYRYAKAGGTALVAGNLAVAATVIGNHENMAVAAAAAIGAMEVTVTLGATAATANYYAGGYLVINDAAGEGVQYLISGHPAADASASLKLTLAEPVKVALTTSSEATLQAHPYSGVVISVTDQADLPVGISNIAVTASYYFWIQTGGACSALADETLALGKQLTIGSSVAGALEVVDAVAEPVVGYAIQAGVDTEYRMVYLSIN